MKRMKMIVAVLLAVVGVQAEVVTVDDVADAGIIQHINYSTKPQGTNVAMYVGRYGTAYQNPVEAPRYWMLIRWDLSSILPGATISNATFQIQQIEYGVGDVDVYVIDSGEWTESEVTWSNWVPTASDTYLGIMHDVPRDQGLTTFNNSNLTAVVQEWVNGDRENLGLVFRWHGDPASGTTRVGDNFAAREFDVDGYPDYDPPQLVITYAPMLVPDPSTIISLKPVSSNVMEMVIDCPTPVLSYPKVTTDLNAVPWTNAAYSTSIGGPYVVTNLGTVAGTNTIYLEANDSTSFYGVGGKD